MATDTSGIDAATGSINALGTAGADASAAMGVLEGQVATSQSAFNSLTTALGQVGFDLKNIGNLTEKQTMLFGLLTTAAIGSRKAFEGLGGIDTKPLNTFTSQIEYLTSTFTDAKSGVGELSKIASSVFGSVMPKAFMTSLDLAKQFVMNLAQNADNALRLQNAFIQLSAQTGNLGEVFKGTKDPLSNVNSLLAQQNNLMIGAMKATGASENAIQGYYMALGTVPKALGEVVTGTGATDSKISMLTATIKVATGTGRQYGDIISDLKVAFKDYGLVGEQALIFTTRFSEIANKFGIELEDVRSGLLGSANAFTAFANAGRDAAKMSEGLASIMNNYVGALKDTGMTGRNAINTVTNMTSALANMRIEQKAFLSGQAGGPGGLMGGFQIEKMLREGKIEEVFDKVRETMQKQFGKIVTLDEAAKSPGAASQLEKQMLILQKGPLGGFVKTDQDAYRLLEAFRAKQTGGSAVTKLDDAGLRHSMEKGTSVEEKSYTELTRIRNNTEAFRKMADTANLGLIQHGMTASAGSMPLGDATGAYNTMTLGLKGTMQAGGKPSGFKTEGAIAGQSIKEFMSWFSTIPESLKVPLEVIKQAVATGKSSNIEGALAKIRTEIDEKKAMAAGMSGPEKAKQLAQAQAEEDAWNKAQAFYHPGATTSGSMLAGATKGTPVKTGKAGTAAAPGSTVTGTNPGEITVHVTGFCLKCKNEIEGGKQAASVTPATKLGP